MSFMDSVAVFTKGLGEKAKGNYDLLALNNKISGSQKEMNNLLSELGRQYFDMHRNDPEDELSDLIEEIMKLESSIEELKKLAEETKTATAAVSLTASSEEKGAVCPKCGSRLDKDSVFCSVCGTRVDVKQPTDQQPTDQQIAGENI